MPGRFDYPFKGDRPRHGTGSRVRWRKRTETAQWKREGMMCPGAELCPAGVWCPYWVSCLTAERVTPS